MNERLKKIRKALNMTQAEFGEKIGLSQNTIANYECGRRALTEQTIRSVCREFNVNIEWLLKGKEPMFIEIDKMDALIAKMLAGQNETAVQLFKAFAELDESDWQIVQKIIDNLKNT